MNAMLLEDCCEILDNLRVPITASERKSGPYPYYGANGIQDYVDEYIFDDELVLLAEDGGNFGSKTRPIAYRVSGKCWVNNHAHVLKPKPGLDVDFLCYSLMFYKTDGLVNGATRQKLTQATMRKMLIPNMTLDNQRIVVDKLNKVLAIKSKREKQLIKLDELIKARFIEMFGDPSINPYGLLNITVQGAIDAGYIEKPLDGNHGNKHPKASEYVEEGVPFVMANDIVDGKVDFINCSKLTRERADKLDKGFAYDGDVLITHKGTIGRTAILHTDLDYVMLTPQVTYYRPKKGILAEYLKGYFDTDFFQGRMKLLAESGGSTRAYVGITNQTQLPLLIPNIDKQRGYIDFAKQIDKSKFVGMNFK